MDTKHIAPGTRGTFSAVLDEYEASSAFTKNAPGTQANYRRILRWAHDALGAIPVADIKPSLVQYALDKLADRPATQLNARAVLGAVDKWATVREKLPRQITFGTSAPGSDGGHQPWSDEQVTLAERYARSDLSRVITLAVNTGQRGSDIVRMRLSDLEDRKEPRTGALHTGINVVQKKTGLRLWVPLTDALAAKIAEWRPTIRPPWLFVTKTMPQPDWSSTPAQLRPHLMQQFAKHNGTAYVRPNLSWHWNHERETNPLLAPLRDAGLTLHGLRATCVVRLRREGASVLHICSMVGMSEPMVSRYSRLADQGDMAMAAVHFLNMRTERDRRPLAANEM